MGSIQTTRIQRQHGREGWLECCFYPVSYWFHTWLWMSEVWFQGVANICMKWVSPGGLWVVPYRPTVVTKPQELTIPMH